MERKKLYRVLLVVVLILTIIYTLGILGYLPYSVSYYITLFFIVLFMLLRLGSR
ncbi:hypothetical protein PNA2_0969 [Pyrococcus sp. NA2]|uniref:hypothetical protein n=1 Tax=Pyrococcus sp. (strain NA2) TaxID=342949 RepID=UPI000209A980|nr:hypothetical protein [Pyrococcus sp. NA2]AEC51886.1 hypothetical protein PNA2_0969 [Pyrococcus sp. NA2]